MRVSLILSVIIHVAPFLCLSVNMFKEEQAGKRQ